MQASHQFATWISNGQFHVGLLYHPPQANTLAMRAEAPIGYTYVAIESVVNEKVLRGGVGKKELGIKRLD